MKKTEWDCWDGFDREWEYNEDAEIKNSFAYIASAFCRFDRNVLMSHNFLSCVLYDKEGRT